VVALGGILANSKLKKADEPAIHKYQTCHVPFLQLKKFALLCISLFYTWLECYCVPSMLGTCDTYVGEILFLYLSPPFHSFIPLNSLRGTLNCQQMASSELLWVSHFGRTSHILI